MALVAPFVLGILGKRASEQRLDSTGLANVLLNEKSDIAAAAPQSVSPSAEFRTYDSDF